MQSLNKMTIKKQVLDEIIQSDKEAVYDINLNSTKCLEKAERRKIIFELVEDGRIQFVEKHHIDDDRFPLLIAPVNQ